MARCGRCGFGGRAGDADAGGAVRIGAVAVASAKAVRRGHSVKTCMQAIRCYGSRRNYTRNGNQIFSCMSTKRFVPGTG